MSAGAWNLDHLKRELGSRPALKGWAVWQETVHRRERYLLSEGDGIAADQDREVRTQAIHAKLIVRLPGKTDRQGEITKKLFPAMPLAPQLDSATEAALQTDHQAWDFPKELPKQVPALRTADPKMAEDLEGVLRELTRQIATMAQKPRETRFNSAELFLSVHDSELHLSNGLTHRTSQSRVYTEAAFSYTAPDESGKPKSDEYLNTRWAVSLADLDVEKLFEDTSDRARYSLDCDKPKTGRYPVIIDADVLATLFNTQMGQLSSANSYHGLPFIKPGDELIPGASGDLLTITLDPTLEFGADTAAVSESGIVQTPFRLVEANRVVATSTDKRYADYLGTPVTTVRGNVVVDAGRLTHEELTRQAPEVLEILQFSGLFADANSGTFSSEIRLARLYDNRARTVRYIKGGSLSGSFRDNFKGARLSKNRVKRATFQANGSQGEGYFGPEYVLLSDVSVVG